MKTAKEMIEVMQANGEWVWFHICDLFAHEKDGWAIVTTASDMCECFEEKE